MTPKFNAIHLIKFIRQEILATPGFLYINLFGPLKGRERLRHKSRDPNIHPGATHDLTASTKGFDGQISNGHDIIIALRRQTNHEVQFHVIPATGIRLCRHGDEVFVWDPFVDHSSQTRTRRFRRERKSSTAHVSDLVGQSN